MNDIIDKIFGFITGLGVITGGLISIAWFAGSLLVYCLLDRPIWEKAILLGITIFIFIWFCVSTIRKRKPKSNSNKRSDGSMLDEHLQELKGVLDEIDEELSEAHCVRDEEKIKEMSDDLPPLKEFILPGGSEFNSRLHIARTTCRNSERSLVAMHQKQERNDLHAKYLNRLSDYLFLLARVVRLKKNQEEEHWELNK